MYLPPLTPETLHYSSWETRRNLLRGRISEIGADVVCFQEVAPESFESDFQFMSDLGYDGKEMFKRGRFRPATFWKTSRVEIVETPVHKDRTLLTSFNLVTDNLEDKRSWHVLNCHLQAGKQGSRRVRQIVEGISAAVKQAKRIKEADPTNPLLIVCGDFNGMVLNLVYTFYWSFVLVICSSSSAPVCHLFDIFLITFTSSTNMLVLHDGMVISYTRRTYDRQF